MTKQQLPARRVRPVPVEAPPVEAPPVAVSPSPVSPSRLVRSSGRITRGGDAPLSPVWSHFTLDGMNDEPPRVPSPVASNDPTLAWRGIDTGGDFREVVETLTVPCRYTVPGGERVETPRMVTVTLPAPLDGEDASAWGRRLVGPNERVPTGKGRKGGKTPRPAPTPSVYVGAVTRRPRTGEASRLPASQVTVSRVPTVERLRYAFPVGIVSDPHRTVTVRTRVPAPRVPGMHGGRSFIVGTRRVPGTLPRMVTLPAPRPSRETVIAWRVDVMTLAPPLAQHTRDVPLTARSMTFATLREARSFAADAHSRNLASVEAHRMVTFPTRVPAPRVPGMHGGRSFIVGTRRVPLVRVEAPRSPVIVPLTGRGGSPHGEHGAGSAHRSPSFPTGTVTGTLTREGRPDGRRGASTGKRAKGHARRVVTLAARKTRLTGTVLPSTGMAAPRTVDTARASRRALLASLLDGDGRIG